MSYAKKSQRHLPIILEICDISDWAKDTILWRHIMAKALVLYHSQVHGNTAALAEAVISGLKEGGCSVDSHNTNESRYNIDRFPQYDCVAIGSPDYFSYIAGGLKMFLDDHWVAIRFQKKTGFTNKPYALFYTHGRGGRIKDVIGRLFGNIGTLIGEPVGCQETPQASDLDNARKLGLLLAKSTLHSS
jgi:flavorubredoxin